MQRKPLTHLLVLLAVVGLASSFVFDPKLDPNGDNATYLLLGKALAGGAGYVELFSLPHVRHCQYPPVYPALIAGVLKATGWWDQHQLACVKALNVALFGVSIVLLYLIACRMLPEKGLALPVALLTGLNAHLLRFSVIEMSEMAHLVWVLAAVLCVLLWEREQELRRKAALFGLALAFLSLCYYTRTAGVSLAVAMVVYLLVERRWRAAGVCATFAVVQAIPWWLWCRGSSGAGYVGQMFARDPYNLDAGRIHLHDLALRVVQNVDHSCAFVLPDALVPALGSMRLQHVVAWALGAALLALVVYGAVRCGRACRLAALYCLCTVSMLLLWPGVWAGVRFCVSLVPLLTLFACVGVWAVAQRLAALHKPALRVHPALLSLLLVFHLGPVWTLHKIAKAPYDRALRNYISVANWAGRNTPPDAVFSCRKPTVFSYFSGRPATVYLFTSDRASLFRDLCAQGVDYVVLDQLGYRATGAYLFPARQEYRGVFRPVYQVRNPDTYVLAMSNPGVADGRALALARALSVQGLQSLLASQYPQALESFRRAESFYRLCRPLPLGELGRLNNNAGTLFFRQAQYDSALVRIALAQEGLEHESPPDLTSLAQVRFNRASAHDFAGDDATALVAYLDALQFASANLGERHAAVAKVLNNLGRLHQRHGQRADAEKCYRAAISICEQSGPGMQELLDLVQQNLQSLGAEIGRSKTRSDVR